MEIAIIENRKDLERLEGIIEKNLTAFYEVGKALIQIKQREYYIDVLGYDTFEQYCRERWDMSKRHAYRLIDSCKVIDVVKSDQLVTPSTESQCRPLSKLEPEQQVKAWEMAVETAPDGKVTARHVSKVVKELIGSNKTKYQQGQIQEPSDAMYFVKIAISQLERIHPKDPNRNKALNYLSNWISKNK